ncbi:MFS transporter [Legionella israelensis]|uniref:MFS transporter n=1 Tax=Legionella israelensis TaxID=454 RepID=UPI00117FD483|nr:MFS transporter [Legionella israelensis]QDP72932.1 MFS transporter [Legionella israelensis]
MNKNAHGYAWFIFLLSAAFCAYEFVLRVKISPLSNQLLTEFNTSANALGLLSSAFFYGYAPVQLLSGPLIQRYGPRKILILSLTICTVSTLFFAIAYHFAILFFLRFLVGLGSGFAFVGAYILIANWFPSRQWPFLYGLLQFMSCLGAMYGQQLLAFFSVGMSWRRLSLIIGYSGLGLMLLFYFFLKNHSKYQESPSIKAGNKLRFLSQLKRVAQNPSSYPIALYAFFTWGPITISATLWGPAFLAEKLLISLTEASYLFSYTWLGIALGSPFIGYWATRVPYPKYLMLSCSALGFTASFFLLNQHIYSIGLYKFILFFLGFSTAAQPISFVKIQQTNPEHCRGTSVGFNNTAVILSGAFLQPLSSFLIEHSHRLNQANYSYNYTLDNYHNGLVLMPVCFLISFILAACFIKEPLHLASTVDQSLKP